MREIPPMGYKESTLKFIKMKPSVLLKIKTKCKEKAK